MCIFLFSGCLRVVMVALWMSLAALRCTWSMPLRRSRLFHSLLCLLTLSLTECVVMLDVYVLLFSFSFDSSFFTVATIPHRRSHTVKCCRFDHYYYGNDGSALEAKELVCNGSFFQLRKIGKGVASKVNL